MTAGLSAQLAWPDPPWSIGGRTLTAWFAIDPELLSRVLPAELSCPPAEPAWGRLRFYDARFESLADGPTHPLVPRSGTFREAVIAFPACAGPASGDATIFMWADSEAYSTWGREVFGWPILAGRIDLEGSVWGPGLEPGAAGSARARMVAGSAALTDVEVVSERESGQSSGWWLTPRRTLLRAGLDGEQTDVVAVRSRLAEPGTAYECRAEVSFRLDAAHPLHGLAVTAHDVSVVDEFSLVVGEEFEVHAPSGERR